MKPIRNLRIWLSVMAMLVLAVIQWKKVFGFYQDLGKERNSTYTINTGQLIHEDAA